MSLRLDLYLCSLLRIVLSHGLEVGYWLLGYKSSLTKSNWFQWYSVVWLVLAPGPIPPYAIQRVSILNFLVFQVDLILNFDDRETIELIDKFKIRSLLKLVVYSRDQRRICLLKLWLHAINATYWVVALKVSGRFLAEPIVLNDPLRPALSRDPEAVALHDLNRSMSWAELEQSCHALAKHYLGIGLRPGDRIASLMPNSLELLIHYLAGLRCVLVLTPLIYRYTVPEINHALDVSGARCLIHHCERQTDVDASNVPTDCNLGCITTNDDGFVSE